MAGWDGAAASAGIAKLVSGEYLAFVVRHANEKFETSQVRVAKLEAGGHK